MKGPDHKFALNPLELKQLVLAIRETEKALGSSFKKVEKEEEELFYFAKRGIQALSPIRKGEVFSHENIGVLRPGNQKKGIAPRHLKALLGKKAKKTLSLGEGVQWEDFE
jgi:N-acetylneuraminate synthase